LSEKETPEFIPPQLWLLNLPDLSPVDYSMLGILQEKVYKTCITDLDELKQLLRMEWAKLDHVVGGVVDSSRSLMRISCTFSCNIFTRCSQLDLDVANLEATVEMG